MCPYSTEPEVGLDNPYVENPCPRLFNPRHPCVVFNSTTKLQTRGCEVDGIFFQTLPDHTCQERETQLPHTYWNHLSFLVPEFYIRPS